MTDPCMPRRRARRWPGLAFCGVLASFAGTPPVDAADEQAFLRCGAIEADDERLACYDAAYRDVARTVPAAQAAENEQPEVADESRFGQRRRAEPLPKSLRASVERVARTPAGRLLFYLDNGQTWQQVESKRLDLPELPAAIEIRRAALGSYKLSFQDHSGWTRVKRLQ